MEGVPCKQYGIHRTRQSLAASKGSDQHPTTWKKASRTWMASAATADIADWIAKGEYLGTFRVCLGSEQNIAGKNWVLACDYHATFEHK